MTVGALYQTVSRGAAGRAGFYIKRSSPRPGDVIGLK